MQVCILFCYLTHEFFLALTPKAVKDFIDPIFNWARRLQTLHAEKKLKKSAVVTVSI